MTRREDDAPVSLSGDSSGTLDVVIERILPGGDGIAHAGGKTILVGLAAPGDHLRVRIDRKHGKIAFASIVDIIERSTSRVSPACSYFGRCGGCDFQQLSYEAQLAAKVSIIRDCLRRIARIDYQHEIPITPSPSAWQYRSSARWKFDPVKSHLGYFESGSHSVCDVTECPILVPALQETLQTLRGRMNEGTLPLGATEFEAVAGDEGVSVAPPVEERETLEVGSTILGDRFAFSADTFFQINQQILPSLIEAAIGDAGGETALDLYCGAGLFTLQLARRFSRVTGVEAHQGAVSFARRNLSGASLSNANIKCSTVGEYLRNRTEIISQVDLILLDPPRSGVEKGVIEAIVSIRPKRMTYVSCDPATLARDLKPLIAAGYALDSIAAFDMFPQTHHVETVARLSKAVL